MEKEMRNQLISIGLLTIGICFFAFVLMPNIEAAMGKGELISQCYDYVNSTHGVQYWFGKCYMPVYNHYETKEVCNGGLLGLFESCYESSESHYETYTSSKCIVAKTGERC